MIVTLTDQNLIPIIPRVLRSILLRKILQDTRTDVPFIDS